MYIKSLKLTNLLSFGPDTESLALQPLNVLIGPNGAGKSNFLEALALLQATPGLITTPIRDGGGIQDWLHKSCTQPTGQRVEARLEIVLSLEDIRPDLRYGLAFQDVSGRLEITDEYLENAEAQAGHAEPYFYYRWDNGHPVLNVAGQGQRGLQRESIKPDQSILAQRRDSDLYPELTLLAETFGSIQLYRDWTWGRYTAARQPQKTDLPTDRLLPDATNLALVINRVRRDGSARKRLIDALRRIYEGVEDIHVDVAAGSAQLFLLESAGSMPATRLSDGTLRYLMLLTLLCDPNPPPLLVLEEPELGLHPDLLPTLATLLVDASQRTQLIVTTHAPTLVDALTEHPESLIICERRDGGATRMERLDAAELSPWLDKFRLGQLWTSGELGGTRW